MDVIRVFLGSEKIHVEVYWWSSWRPTTRGIAATCLQTRCLTDSGSFGKDSKDAMVEETDLRFGKRIIIVLFDQLTIAVA